MSQIKTEHGVFTDRINMLTGELLQTAEEVYQEWPENKDKQTDNCLEPTTEERVLKLEEEKAILADNVYQLASIIEIMLGGISDGQTEATTTDTAN